MPPPSSSTQPSAPSPEQAAFTETQTALAEEQLAAIQPFQEFLSQLATDFGSLGPLLLQQAGFVPSETTTTVPNPEFQEIQGRIDELLELQAQPGPISPTTTPGSTTPSIFEEGGARVLTPAQDIELANLQAQLAETPEFIDQAGFEFVPDEQGQQLQATINDLIQQELEAIQAGPGATPEQIELIEQAAGETLAAGESEIERFQTGALETLREELAPGLGLRPSDTPILDRGARVTEEAVRQQGQLARTIREAAARARLNFPLAAGQFQAGRAGLLAGLSQGLRGFQEQLRQQAFLNRTGLAQQVGGFGLGLATGIPVVNPGFARGSTTTQGGFGLGGLGSLLSGLGAFGSLFGGGGAGAGAGAASTVFAAPFPFPSSHKFKTSGTQIDEEKALGRVEELPIEAWRYKEGLGLDSTRRHIGPYAEDMADLGLSDGLTIHPVDVAGLGLAAVKGLAKRVRRLERQDDGGFAPAPEDEIEHAKGRGLGLVVSEDGEWIRAA